MGSYVISESSLTQLANAIREKTGTSKQFSVADMIRAIRGIVSNRDIDGIIERTSTEINIDYVTKIGASAFYGYTSLQSATFDSVRTIGNDAFNGCSSLVSIELPSLAILGARVFNNCTSLTTLDLRDSKLTAIPANSFSGSSLTEIWLPSSVFCSAVQNSFAGCPLASGGSGGTIYVPSRYRTTYESNPGWATIIRSGNNRIVSY